MYMLSRNNPLKKQLFMMKYYIISLQGFITYLGQLCMHGLIINDLGRGLEEKSKIDFIYGRFKHMWLADGDSLMCFIVRMSKPIA